MKETGRVVGVENSAARILIKRHTACKDCGACQVGREKLEMVMTAENVLDAQVGDEVEVELETSNFLAAVLIGYGIPLAALLLGVLSGYGLSPLLGIGHNAGQGIAGVLGLLFMIGSYYVIKRNDDKIRRLKKFNPVIVGIIKKEENDG